MKIFIFTVLATFLFLQVGYAQKKVSTNISEKGIDFVYKGKTRLSGGKPKFEDRSNVLKCIDSKAGSVFYHYDKELKIETKINQPKKNIWGMYLSLPQGEKQNGKKFAGYFFDEISDYKTGVEIWRYKPWNSWTKPLRVDSPADLHDWDVQFFYWQYDDGLYGAAIPLSGNGYRTTLGAEDEKFGCKAYTYTNEAAIKDIPMMAIGFGNDPYQLFADLYQEGLKMMGKEENMLEKKVYPDALEYIGWCTWNSSEMGKHLDEKHLLEGTATFTDNDFPLGWILIDDGWFDHDGSMLNNFTPNPEKFPNGFKSLTSKLKSDYSLKHVGIWHAYDGYWNGINADSELGRRYKNELFTWTQNERVDVESKKVTYSFIKPESDSLLAFYDHWHKYLKNEGFTFLKVDNQLVSERMSVDNFPIDLLAVKMHEALYASVFTNFDGALINCMDMTNEAFYNFGKTAVARTVEDYFPERDRGVGYELERGGAAAHVLMALYNSLYFSQMAFTDYDMFESDNTYAAFHAAARAISGGPVYVTDLPGKQNFDILWPLIDKNGRIIRADKPGILTRDCLFQLQDEKPLKAFSFARNSGLLAVFNASDADQVQGTFSPEEIYGLEGKTFVAYEFYSGNYTVLKKTEKNKIELKRMGNQYYNIVPVEHGVALIGLVNKYNAPKTILSSKIDKKRIEVHLIEGGTFKAIVPKKPVSVLFNNVPVNNFNYDDKLFTVDLKSENSENSILILNFN